MTENIKEQWKPVLGYEDYYHVSSLGRVRSLDREIPSRGGVRTIKGRVLRACTCSGYKYFSAVVDGDRVNYYIHRAVAIAFLGNPLGYSEVNHKDGDKGNNCELNLEWCSSSQNKRHAIATGLRKPISGVAHAGFKGTVLAYDSAGDIKFRLNGKAEILANGFDSSCVSKCLKGLRSSHRGHTFVRLKHLEEKQKYE